MAETTFILVSNPRGSSDHRPQWQLLWLQPWMTDVIVVRQKSRHSKFLKSNVWRWVQMISASLWHRPGIGPASARHRPDSSSAVTVDVIQMSSHFVCNRCLFEFFLFLFRVCSLMNNESDLKRIRIKVKTDTWTHIFTSLVSGFMSGWTEHLVCLFL